MKQLAWALFQLVVGYSIVIAFNDVEIGVWPFIAVVVGGAFVASLMLALAMKALASRVRGSVPARRDPVLTEWSF